MRGNVRMHAIAYRRGQDGCNSRTLSQQRTSVIGTSLRPALRKGQGLSLPRDVADPGVCVNYRKASSARNDPRSTPSTLPSQRDLFDSPGPSRLRIALIWGR